MRHRTVILIVIWGLFVGYAAAQSEPDLDRLDEKLSRHLEMKMPGWKHKRIEPIQGSSGVLIEAWSGPNRGVKIAVSTLKSAEEARRSLQSFVKDTKEATLLKGFGDEAYVWGFEGSDIVVRRGRHIVYINAGASVDEDPDARALSNSERRAREHSEMKRLTKEFAKHMVDAIDLP
jgi:hypothetical protein